MFFLPFSTKCQKCQEESLSEGQHCCGFKVLETPQNIEMSVVLASDEDNQLREVDLNSETREATVLF